MWFKNIQIYSFTESFNYSAEQLDDLLGKHPFTPISQMQESTFGWVPSFKDSQLFCENVTGRLFFSAQIQEKILPASVVNDHLNEKLDEIELAEGRRPGRKEREQLKEDIRAVLLPKAFNKTKRISAWIDPKQGWLIVNASSEKTADDFTAHLREAIGTLSVIPFAKAASGSDVLTQWFLEPTERPASIEIESDMELTLAQDSTVKAKYKNLDLNAPEIQHSLVGGMRIRQLAMAFDEQCQFVLNEKFQIKRVKFHEKLVDQASDSDDPRTDTILMSDTLSQLIQLIEPFTQTEAV